MKCLKLIILLVFSTFSTLRAQEVPEDVIKGFGLGNIDMIQPFLAEEVELIILNEEGLFSKDMTSKKLTNYFKEINPEELKIVHTGASPSGTSYAIGEMICEKESLRLYLLFSGKNYSNISEIRIEKDE